jgi:hypothetical protein
MGITRHDRYYYVHPTHYATAKVNVQTSAHPIHHQTDHAGLPLPDLCLPCRQRTPAFLHMNRPYIVSVVPSCRRIGGLRRTCDIYTFHQHRLLLLLFRLVRHTGSERRVEALPQCADHLTKPIPVQPIQREIRCQVADCEPHRHSLIIRKPHDLSLRAETESHGAVVQLLLLEQKSGLASVQRAVDIVEDADGLVAAPNYATGEECEEQDDAVIEL